jgi:hypothetical protein
MILVAWICLLGACEHQAVTGGNEPCGPGGTCPVGYSCQNGLCVGGTGPTECDLSDPQYEGWPDDSDLEPNDHPDNATVLHCGDDAVFTNPVEYVARCPSRENYVNGFMNLLTCPGGDRDFYAIYLLPAETVRFNLLYQYAWDPPRDLDIRVWCWDYPTNDWRDDVAVGLSTNDNEELTVSTAAGSSNPQGWYYLEVFGKTAQDMNFYAISFTLNEGTMP